MGQTEIYEFLKRQRLSGNNNHYSTLQIYQALRNQGHDCTRVSVALQVHKLYEFGYCERIMPHVTDRKYRLRMKYTGSEGQK